MSMAGMYMGMFTPIQYLEFFLRLLIAFILGGSIGFERSRHFKEAGVRTHIIVCVTAALIMLISKYGFADLSQGNGMEFYGTKGADSARVAAQAVSGISFLCAGVIIKVGGNIKGLTTAAGIWMTASIGLAIGAGMYVVTACMALLLGLLHFVVYRIPIGTESYDGYHLTFVVKSEDNFDEILKERIKVWNARITERNIRWKRNDVTEFDYVIVRPEEIHYGDIKAFVNENPSVISFSYNPLLRHIS